MFGKEVEFLALGAMCQGGEARKMKQTTTKSRHVSIKPRSCQVSELLMRLFLQSRVCKWSSMFRWGESDNVLTDCDPFGQVFLVSGRWSWWCCIVSPIGYLPVTLEGQLVW